jgi:hypothetical protein
MLAILAERRWEEAARLGALDDLPCSGRPLQWEDERLVPPEWRVAFHLLKNAGLAPGWIALDGQIRAAAEAALRDLLQARHSGPMAHKTWWDACVRFRQRVAAINESIADLNVVVPSSQLQRCPLRPDRIIAQLTGETGESEPAVRRSSLR